ncbi:unnamed protein product, partial [Laminaria digitata]
RTVSGRSGRRSGGSDMGSDKGRGGGGGGSSSASGGGASRRLYAKLHGARARRASIAAEQNRRSSILEMTALGRLGRTWGLYPWAPYLPRGPYHTPGVTPPHYNWGPGIGPSGGPTPDGMDGTGPPSSSWAGGGFGGSRWGRRLGWRGLSGWGGAGCAAGGVGFGGG